MIFNELVGISGRFFKLLNVGADYRTAPGASDQRGPKFNESLQRVPYGKSQSKEF